MKKKLSMQKLKKFSVFFMLLLFVSTEVYGISVDALKVPMGDLKKEVFGWMFGVKVMAVAVGGAFALAKQSLMPFGVGAGITAGIHFFDKFIGDASAALIC